jgi:UDP-N-acetylglucosamine 2-epimerase (non-hydrolysing)
MEACLFFPRSDTTPTHCQVPVAHVEAGLRTYSLYNPFPEEANRRLIGAIASYNFAATKRSQDALLQVRAVVWMLTVPQPLHWYMHILVWQSSKQKTSILHSHRQL